MLLELTLVVLCTETMEIREHEVKTWLSFIHKFMTEFGWLADSFVLDFYTKSHWNTLPPSWRTYLSQITPNDLADLIDLNVKTVPCINSSPPPLSLICFKKTSLVLSLPRTYSPTHLNTFLSTLSPHTPPPPQSPYTPLLTRHVKLKKRHEITSLTPIISTLSTHTSSPSAYDIGSGLGHLSRHLTYTLNLKMTCIDKQPQLSSTATKFDTQLKSFIQKKNPTFLPPPPSHKQATLDFSTNPEIFIDTTTRFGFTGLHACGNLSPLILHNYVHSNAQYLVSLGCCYMKMDERGFPLSPHSKNIGLKLSFEALEVACHATEQYCQKLRDGQVKKLITHSYRATLEQILQPLGITHAGLHTVPHTEDLTFEQYATLATSKLNLNSPLPLTTPTTKSNISEWFKVATFYSLRLLLANTIESAVLLDRALYLKTTRPTNTTYITPIFSPTISPRNIAIISHV